MHLLQKSGQKPERKQLKKRANEAGVDEAVGKRLPKKAMQKAGRIKGQQAEEAKGRFG